MVSVNGHSIPFRQGMTAMDAMLEAGASASNSVVVVNGKIVFDPRLHSLADGDDIVLLKIISGG